MEMKRRPSCREGFVGGRGRGGSYIRTGHGQARDSVVNNFERS